MNLDRCTHIQRPTHVRLQIAEVEFPDNLLHHGNCTRRTGQFLDPQPDQQRHRKRVAGHLAAERQRNAGFRSSPDAGVDQGEHGGIQRIGGDRGRRNFDHQSDRDLAVKIDSGAFQIALHLVDQLFCAA